MAKIIAKLVKGNDYYILGTKFVNGKDVEIDDTLKKHLENNSQFEIIEVDEKKEENTDEEHLKDSDKELDGTNEEVSKQKGMVLKGKGAKNKQEGDE